MEISDAMIMYIEKSEYDITPMNLKYIQRSIIFLNRKW
jgi:hypothetical protein